MSINEIMSSALSGLNAAQAGLANVANNVANADTPGYARQLVPQSARTVAGRTAGVTLGEVERIASRFLEDAVFRRGGEAGRADVEADFRDRAQALLGEPASTTGLPARIDAAAAAAIRLASVPDTSVAAGTFVAAIDDAIDTMRFVQDEIGRLAAQADGELADGIEQANSLLTRIHGLNFEIAQRQGFGDNAPGLSDQRMRAIEELGQLIAIEPRSRPDGRIDIDLASGGSLLDHRLSQLAHNADGGITLRRDGPGDPAQTLTGDVLGGRLGGLAAVRDHILPEQADAIGQLFTGFARAINAASNLSTAAPPPPLLSGRPTGLVGSDLMNFTGTAIFIVTDPTGNIVQRADVDLGAMGPGATIDQALGAINAALGGTATASLGSNGAFTLQTANGTHGIAVAGGSPPAMRAGSSFSAFFGLNDLIRGEQKPLFPSGLGAADAHGFDNGETVSIVLRDGTGRLLGRQTLTMQAGGTMGDIIDQLGASPLGQFGTFSLSDDGALAFNPVGGRQDMLLSVPSDSTNRHGTGISFSSLVGLGAGGLADAAVDAAIAASPSRLPLARIDTSAFAGDPGWTRADARGAQTLTAAFSASAAFGRLGEGPANEVAARLLGRIGADAARAEARRSDTDDQLTAAIDRRDGYSGVNLDEELAQMVVLQNSYAASARIMNSAKEMYDALLSIA